MNKVCFKCGQTKDVNEFYRHPMMGDGRLGKCKECTKRDVKKNKASKIEYYRAYARARGNKQPPGYVKEYRTKNPDKYAATMALNNAVRDGRTSRLDSCEICGSFFAVEAHHHDYARPFDVWWLCAACHKTLHAIIRRLLRNAA